MNWLNIFILLSLFLGFVSGIANLKSMRSKISPQAEIAWKQEPLSMWRYEPLSVITIMIHSLGLFSLTACLLFNLIHNEILAFPAGLRRAELFILALVAIFFTTNAAGTALAYHFVRRWIRPISYGISNNGMFFGGKLIVWKSYSHYEIGPDDGQISLYSSYSPSLRTWVLRPPAESLSRVLAIVQGNLSSMPPMEDETLWHSPSIMILGMIVLVLSALLPAVWGLMQNLSWVWIYALVAFFLVSILGNKWMAVYDGRGKYPEQKVQTT